MKIMAEYIWVDGKKPTATLRSKTKILSISQPLGKDPEEVLKKIPEWGFDGSSTNQSLTNNSDLILKPRRVIKDPVEKPTSSTLDNVLVLCEVFHIDGTPHQSNTRAYLREVYDKYKFQEPIFGIEQEYTFYRNGRPLGWPQNHDEFPPAQGGTYCGVGCDEVHGRELVKHHTRACLDSKIPIYGTNGEVMRGQWEFQLDATDPLTQVDNLLLARWLLYRLGEEYNIYVKLHPKPVRDGDWNGAGGHTNFSTKEMREDGGIEKILDACNKLAKFHQEHLVSYGAHNEERLIGALETSSYEKFKFSELDRSASVRIPSDTVKNSKGYFEDRRPAANADFYVVCAAILETVLGKGYDPRKVPTFCSECERTDCIC